MPETRQEIAKRRAEAAIKRRYVATTNAAMRALRKRQTVMDELMNDYPDVLCDECGEELWMGHDPECSGLHP